MIRFISQFDKNSPKVDIKIPNQDADLGQVLEIFQGFLTATGYSINGIIDVLDTEEKD